MLKKSVSNKKRTFNSRKRKTAKRRNRKQKAGNIFSSCDETVMVNKFRHSWGIGSVNTNEKVPQYFMGFCSNYWCPSRKEPQYQVCGEYAGTIPAFFNPNGGSMPERNCYKCPVCNKDGYTWTKTHNYSEYFKNVFGI